MALLLRLRCYNTSRCDFDKPLADALRLAANPRNYITGYDANIREGQPITPCPRGEPMARRLWPSR